MTTNRSGSEHTCRRSSREPLRRRTPVGHGAVTFRASDEPARARSAAVGERPPTARTARHRLRGLCGALQRARLASESHPPHESRRRPRSAREFLRAPTRTRLSARRAADARSPPTPRSDVRLTPRALASSAAVTPGRFADRFRLRGVWQPHAARMDDFTEPPGCRNGPQPKEVNTTTMSELRTDFLHASNTARTQLKPDTRTAHSRLRGQA